MRVGLDVTPLLVRRQSGIAVFVRELFDRLRVDDRVSLAAYAISSRSPTHSLIGENACLARPFPRWRGRFPAKAALPLWTKVSFPPAELWLGKCPDVIHGTNFLLPPAWRRCVQVITIHDLSFVYYPERGSSQKLAVILRAISRGAWVHVPSNSVKQDLLDIVDISPDRIRVIPHAAPFVAPETPESQALARVMVHGRPYILAIGDVVRRKQFPLLVRCFAEVASQSKNIRLLIVGNRLADPIEQRRLEAAVRTSPFSDRISMSDWISRELKSSLLRRAAVLVYPSLYEGFGLPILEAQSVHVPVVAANTGGIPFAAGKGARFVKAGDETALAHALIEVVSSQSERSRLIEAGMANVMRFSWDRVAEQLISLYSGDRDQTISADTAEDG
jgi:glycosyltransferase involved in cell wall biosynthesis